jgi:hypothetical protein
MTMIDPSQLATGMLVMVNGKPYVVDRRKRGILHDRDLRLQNPRGTEFALNKFGSHWQIGGIGRWGDLVRIQRVESFEVLPQPPLPQGPGFPSSFALAAKELRRMAAKKDEPASGPEIAPLVNEVKDLLK